MQLKEDLTSGKIGTSIWIPIADIKKRNRQYGTSEYGAVVMQASMSIARVNHICVPPVPPSFLLLEKKKIILYKVSIVGTRGTK